MIYCGDSLEVLKTLPDESVQCCVTSPPYWGLRDYGVEGQIGLEETLGDHLERLVEVFREVRRVLKPNGVLWVNYGDTYLQPHGKGFKPTGGRNFGIKKDELKTVKNPLPKKNLMGLPWRMAFALQDDGWILRSEIIWYKPNAMPESAKDRPTKAHEHVFLLSKAEDFYFDNSHLFLFAKNEKYYFDHEAIKEPRTTESIEKNKVEQLVVRQKENTPGREGVRRHSRQDWGNDYTSELRNARTVWTIPTQGTKEAHYATFPDELARRCIVASTKVYDEKDKEHFDLVLDPFLGTGTTYKMAEGLGRRAIGIELNPESVEIARNKVGMFVEVAE